MAPYIFPSIIWTLQVPWEEKQPNNMMLPPPNFIPPNTVCGIITKKFDLASSDQTTFSQKFTDSNEPWWACMEAVAVECIAYCFLCDNCTCCLQVLLELFLSGPWLLGYSSDCPDQKSCEELLCVALMEEWWSFHLWIMVSMVLTETFRSCEIWSCETCKFHLWCSATILLRRSWESCLPLLILRCLYTCIQRWVSLFLTYKHAPTQLAQVGGRTTFLFCLS